MNFQQNSKELGTGNKTKEQFEKYLNSHPITPVGVIRDEYWRIWQASRAEIVVEMPCKRGKYNTRSNGFVEPRAESYDEAIDDCTYAIREAGISVKGDE